MTLRKWGGRAATAWTAAVLDRHGRVCWLKLPGCTVVATTGDHIVPRSVAPDLQYDVDNGRPACLSCNQRRSVAPADTASLVVDNRGFFESPT